MTYQSRRSPGLKTMSALACLSLLAGVLGSVGSAIASSHREAPAIAQDPAADATDLYAFVSPKDASKVVIVANSYPFQYPDAGPNYFTFSDSVVYGVHIDTDGDAKANVNYMFTFSTKIDNGGTFLFNTKPVAKPSDLNVHQYWKAYKVMGQFTAALS